MNRMVLGATALLLAIPGSAAAETFCVHSPDGCVGTAETTLQAAVNAAGANGSGKDTIQVGVGLFDEAPVVDNAGNPVDIVGTAANQTALTSSNPVAITLLTISEPSSTVKKFRVHLKSGAGSTGIDLAGHADDVLVTNQSAVPMDGIHMTGTAQVTNSAVQLQYPSSGGQSRAIVAGAGSGMVVTDSYLEGTVGASINGGSMTVAWSRIHATQGVVAQQGSATTVLDTAIHVPGPTPANYTVAAVAAAGDNTTQLTATRITGLSDGGTAFGAWAAPNAGAGAHATVNVKGSALVGFSAIADTQASGGATATVTMQGYSAYDFTKIGSSAHAASDINLAGIDPRIEATDTALPLFFDSPLIDKGDPNTSGFILADDTFGTRIRDGNGVAPATADIGAFEYQRVAPVAGAAAAPATADPGVAFSFAGDTSTDADRTDTLTYAWAFDDGATSSLRKTTHAFGTPGDHTATLTVTDPTGQSANAKVTVHVNDTSQPGNPGNGNGNPQQSPAGGPPVLTDLTLKGSALGFTLSAPAAVTLVVQRRTIGRRVGKRCQTATRRNRNLARCVRWVRRGALARTGVAGVNVSSWDRKVNGKRLSPGRYRVSARAKDASGASSNVVRRTFRIR